MQSRRGRARPGAVPLSDLAISRLLGISESRHAVRPWHGMGWMHILLPSSPPMGVVSIMTDPSVAHLFCDSPFLVFVSFLFLIFYNF